MTAPPVAPDVDLTALPYFPLLRRRLFRSEFHLKSTDSEWRAGVTLWVRSWDQQPAGSLPNDDGQLQALAGLARQPAKWRRVRDMALRGWALYDDGRLYHETVAEVVNSAVTARIRSKRDRTNGKPLSKSTLGFAEEGEEGSAPSGLRRARGTRERRRTASPAVNLFQGAFNAVQNLAERNSSDPADSGIGEPAARPLLDRRRSR